jgi:long-chain acyl-CoA synthetase
MGCGESRYIYSEAISPKKPGETEIRRSKFTAIQEELVWKPDEDSDTMQKVFLNAVTKYGSRKFFGTRNNTSNQYEYKSFSEIFNIAKQLGSGMLKLDLASSIEEYQGQQMNLIGIFSKNREEWMYVEYANFLYGFTMVPMYETMGIENFKLILHQTNIKTLFCSEHGVNLLLNLDNFSQLKNVICFDYVMPGKQEKLRSKNLKFYILSHILNAGSIGGFEPKLVQPDDIFSLSYTSGATGLPKAVMLSHKNAVAAIACIKNSDINFTPEDIHLSYLTLAHVFERYCLGACLYFGVKVCFYSGDVLKLKRDITDVNPTVFQSVPRLYNRFYTAINEQFEKLDGFKKKIALKGVQTKIENLRSKNQLTHNLYDSLVFNKTKSAFGGQVRCFVSGSSSISREVLDFLKVIIYKNFYY